MPQEETIDELIHQLKALRLQEEAIRIQQESIHIQEKAVLHRLVAAREKESRAQGRNGQQPRSTLPTTTVFSVGDKVVITNIAVRTANIGDRLGTVTKITNKRVFLRTENGKYTNRAPKNLRQRYDYE
jgi:hypothetical protein